MRRKTIEIVCVFLVAAQLSIPAFARKKGIAQELESAVKATLQPGSITVPATGEIEVAFSPYEGSEKRS